jgi:outer membrane protein assembly factor BamB
VFEDVIYFGTSDTHRFYGLKANDGEVKWTVPLNMRVYAEALAFEGQIIFGCFNGKLYSLNSSDGKVNQIFQTEGSRKNYYNIYKKDDTFKDEFELYGKDMETSEKKILELGAILSTPVIDNGIIYFGDTNGVIYAVRMK